jgi:hypothetical protein
MVEFNIYLMFKLCKLFFNPLISIVYFILFYSEHRKMRAKQQHVCKEMKEYMINTNRKWIISFGIEWSEVQEIAF